MQKSKYITVLVLLLITQILSPGLYGQKVRITDLIPGDGVIYLDPEHGQDENIGVKDSPLRSLYEAARRINQGNGAGAITIILREGIYGLDARVTFQPVNWHFNKEERLTIRAEVLPDDPEWHPGKMPVIVSTMPLNFKPGGKEDPLKGTSYGIQIEISHVTIQGLRVLGTPVHEQPEEGAVRRNYPIVREGEDLFDLHVTQCLFIGDRHAIPNHVAILASGHGVVVDHNVFYGVKDAVVFWDSDRPAEGCEMHHNLMIDNYGAAVWAWSAASDLKYYNNVVANTNVFWVLDEEAKTTYQLSNSMVLGYEELVTKGGGPASTGVEADPAMLKLGKDVILKKDASVEVVEDQTQRNYLHLKPGSPGADLRAGLFKK